MSADESATTPNETKFGSADREPTADEAATAEEQAKDVDVDEVAEHFNEMTEIGANVKGEGEI